MRPGTEAGGPAGPEAAAQRLRVRLRTIRYAAEGVNLFEFVAVDGSELPAFSPGAHVDLHLPGAGVRQYSIASSPRARMSYWLGVKRDVGGRGGSTWLFDRARVGDPFEISAPRNHFPLHEDEAPALLIAGGIGITPIHCMVQALAEQGRDWRLVYAVRNRAQAAYATELSARYGALVYLYVDEENDGRPIDLGSWIATAPVSAHLYCCGPAPMLDAFEAACAGRDPARVHLERFAPVAQAASEGGFTVELARTGRVLAIPAGKTIAEVLIENGVDVSVSCAQGICGTCETRVLSGVPDHRDSLLSAQEKAANDVMMICCSGCRSGSLVLDL
ncbi:MAG: PDR/VanB family oxidoreductase [Burkholderiaceae bacterium]